ncbi:MAG: hypothetical protein WCH01_15410 [Methylococcaceae bacterium]
MTLSLISAAVLLAVVLINLWYWRQRSCLSRQQKTLEDQAARGDGLSFCN